VTRLNTLAKSWNEATMRRIVRRLERQRPSPWPLVGVLAVGLVAGAAIGGYAVSQRRRITKLARYVAQLGDRVGQSDMQSELEAADANTVPLSHHRRKATTEA
jgi:hypothetical protein